MKAKRFTEAQIVGILQEAGGSTSIRELRRRHGVTETTFFRWRARYGGMAQVASAGPANPLPLPFLDRCLSPGCCSGAIRMGSGVLVPPHPLRVLGCPPCSKGVLR